MGLTFSLRNLIRLYDRIILNLEHKLHCLRSKNLILRRNACVISLLLMGGLIYFHGKIFVLSYKPDVQVTIVFVRQDLLIWLQNSQLKKLQFSSLNHFSPMFHFYTFFREYRNGTLSWNGFSFSKIWFKKYQILKPVQKHDFQ